jgi:hypothetical protein
MSKGSRMHRSLPLSPRSALTGVTVGLVLASAGTAYASAPGHLAIRESGRSGQAPKVILKSRPPHKTKSTTAVLRFTGSPGGRFWCRLDGGRWQRCRSPRRYVSLGPGRHTVAIRAASRSGRAAGRPVSVAWTVRAAAGGNTPRMHVKYLGTDAGGVAAYNVTSPDDGTTPQILRVLKPTHPAHGVPHSFLYVLPVEPGVGTAYGDGLETLRQLDAQDKDNLTIIEPSIAGEPWYANNPSDPSIQYETFMADDLVPWVSKNLATSGKEQNWLIGFSKSGFGAQDLILKHPGVFTAAASWDFPADMDTYTSDHGGVVGDGADYGSDANFQANYRLSAAFLSAHKASFLSRNRIWIGGYAVFGTDVADYSALLTAEGIAHTTGRPQQMIHRWDSGWVPVALKALRKDGAALPPGP